MRATKASAFPRQSLPDERDEFAAVFRRAGLDGPAALTLSDEIEKQLDTLLDALKRADAAPTPEPLKAMLQQLESGSLLRGTGYALDRVPPAFGKREFHGWIRDEATLIESTGMMAANARHLLGILRPPRVVQLIPIADQEALGKCCCI